MKKLIIFGLLISIAILAIMRSASRQKKQIASEIALIKKHIPKRPVLGM